MTPVVGSERKKLSTAAWQPGFLVVCVRTGVARVLVRRVAWIGGAVSRIVQWGGDVAPVRSVDRLDLYREV